MNEGGASVLLLGADGFLGRHVHRRLRETGRPVHAVHRSAGDLADRSTAEQVFSDAPPVDEIHHLVTMQRTGAAQYAMQGELLAVNARIHLNVLEGWRLHQPQARLISVGSSCVYPEMDRPIPESAVNGGLVHPSVEGYALAKQVLITGSATYARQYGLSYLHCILATVYGPGDHTEDNRSHFMGGMIHRAVQEKRRGLDAFTVWGKPQTTRDLLYVDDQIDAIFAAVRHFQDRVVNCAANRPITIDAAAQSILRVLQWDAPIVYPQDSFQGTPFKSIDSSDFLNATGWSPRVGLDQGVQAIVRSDYSASSPVDHQ